MAHPFIKAACASAGLVLALAAAGTVHAAKPLGAKPSTSKQPLSVKQKNDMARAMARSSANKAAPRTMAKAEATLVVMAGGVEGMEVPAELYNYLTVERDAKGELRVREHDGGTQTLPRAPEMSNE